MSDFTLPPLVLVPGLLCNQAVWAAPIEGLSGSADTLVADITGQVTVPDMAAAVLDQAPDRLSLAGFSLGSQVALQIMQTAGSRVDRLALLSAYPTRPGPAPSLPALCST